MPFPNEDDNTAAYPTYLSVPILIARNTTNASGENKPRVVGYAFLGPRRKSTSTTGDAWTMEVRKLAVGGGKWYIFPVEGMAGTYGVSINTAYLWFDGHGGNGDGEGSEAGSAESEGSAGSEGSAASYDSYGSERSQGSQTSVSSEKNSHESDDDKDEDSEDEEDDWDDDDDPYGEVEDDDIEYD